MHRGTQAACPLSCDLGKIKSEIAIVSCKLNGGAVGMGVVGSRPTSECVYSPPPPLPIDCNYRDLVDLALLLFGR